jgi:hypothetical protein
MEDLQKHGLPPREHNAELLERSDSTVARMGGVIAAFALLCLILFGTTGNDPMHPTGTPTWRPA